MGRMPQAEGATCLNGPEERASLHRLASIYKSPSKRSLRPAMISCSSISGKPSRR